MEGSNSTELNMLILGETGVGKSTWINSFLNYLTVSTLDEALSRGKLEFLIASSFMVTTPVGKKLQQKEIKVGDDSQNEDMTVGNSATQSATPYKIEVGNFVLRIIDTPGIGDTRGTEQDMKNMQNILDTINHYDSLHGIVVLLKPNNARLGVVFRYVIQELLTHLHRSAARNIVFGFTNTRQTHYQPGDTFPALDKLLTDQAGGLIELTTDTVYNFDSESFRYLAAAKNNVDLGSKEDYAKSWDRSVDEANRMIQYIASLKPHPITNTTTLNASRKLITELTKPMAEISRLITLNIKMNQDESKQLQMTKATGDDLRNKLKVSRIDLEKKELSQPVTVCTNSDCIEVRNCEEGRQITNYVTRCHDPCYLTNVAVDTINTAQLLHCAAMSGGQNCVQCTHSYTEHMHILYEYEEVTKEVEDVGIQELIKANVDDAQLVQAGIETRENLIREYNNERKIIEKANAQFGFYLKQNSITPYSDARLAYLDHLIKQEENKLHATGDNSSSGARKRTQELIDSLQKSKQEYIEYGKILEAAMKSGDPKSGVTPLQGPKDVQKLVKSLYALKHFGKALKDNKDGVVHSFEKAHRSNKLAEVKYVVKPSFSGKSENKIVSAIKKFKNRVSSVL